jgi:hypothetical protein
MARHGEDVGVTRAPSSSVAPPAARLAARLAVVLVAALALGGLTSLGQTLLPDEVSSLANSVTGWTLPTIALVLLTSRSFGEAAASGALSFIALTFGYAVVSTLRGFTFDPLTWAVIGLLAGPVVGVATFALRGRPMQAALGGGLLAGLVIGEGVYGLTEVADTTSPVYWWMAIAVGAALLLTMIARLRAARPALVLVSVAALTAIAFGIAYRALPLLFAAW